MDVDGWIDLILVLSYSLLTSVLDRFHLLRYWLI
jgi:hypothetical protein